MVSEKVKSVLAFRRVGAAANIVFPLPATEHSYAVVIGLVRWLELPIDWRAPIRSVAMVELVGERFIALVIDTVAERPRWLVEGDRRHLSSLYEGMLGGSSGQARRALVISAPNLTSLLRPVRLPLESLRGASGLPDEDCHRLSLASEVPSPDPGGGTRGVVVDPIATLQAQVLADVSNGLADAGRVQISAADGDTQDVLLVASSALL
jgi:hypothetical protein